MGWSFVFGRVLIDLAANWFAVVTLNNDELFLIVLKNILEHIFHINFLVVFEMVVFCDIFTLVVATRYPVFDLIKTFKGLWDVTDLGPLVSVVLTVVDAGDVFGNYRILFKTMGELLYLRFGCQVSQVEEVHCNEENAEVGLSSCKNL